MNHSAPPGHVWVCFACGKTSPRRYGFDESGKNVGMPGWDASCMLNCCLVAESDIEERTAGGRVKRLRDGANARTVDDLMRELKAVSHDSSCDCSTCSQARAELELVASAESRSSSAIARMLESFADGSPEQAASALRIAALAVTEGTWKDWLSK